MVHYLVQDDGTKVMLPELDDAVLRKQQEPRNIRVIRDAWVYVDHLDVEERDPTLVQFRNGISLSLCVHSTHIINPSVGASYFAMQNRRLSP
jgi:hypothetical protein